MIRLINIEDYTFMIEEIEIEKSTRGEPWYENKMKEKVNGLLNNR